MWIRKLNRIIRYYFQQHIICTINFSMHTSLFPVVQLFKFTVRFQYHLMVEPHCILYSDVFCTLQVYTVKRRLMGQSTIKLYIACRTLIIYTVLLGRKSIHYASHVNHIIYNIIHIKSFRIYFNHNVHLESVLGSSLIRVYL